MFGISGTELIIIAAIALMIFGPDRIPEFARTIGRFISEFKRYQETMEATIRAEMYGEKSAERTSEGPVVPPGAVSYEEEDEEEEE